MSKTIQEQIEVMQHFANGGEVEIFTNSKWGDISNGGFANWNFAKYDFRIKEQKKTINIEKWLCRCNNDGEYRIFETSKIETLHKDWERIKKIKTYEVEL